MMRPFCETTLAFYDAEDVRLPVRRVLLFSITAKRSG